MNRIVFVLFFIMLLASCKSKKAEKPEVPAADFFPVKEYLNGQIAQLDTSSLTFQKIETVDGHSDTTSIKNTEVKTYARPFQEIPDLSAKDIKNDYSVDKLYDDIQNAFVFTYTTKEDYPVQQEQITLEPAFNEKGQNDIRSVYIDLWETTKDSSVRKHMMWEANNSFYITTTTEVTGQPEKTKTTKIVWNGFPNANKQ